MPRLHYAQPRYLSIFLLAMFFLTRSPLLFGYPPETGASGEDRPRTWAALVDKRLHLYRMQADLYRSALPDREAQPLLKALGIATVINFYQRSDADWLQDPRIRQIHLPLRADRIGDSDVIETLRSIRQAQALGPVLIHCKHGQNRTGLIAALYRVVYQGWTKPQALAEMRGFSGGRRLDDAERYLRRADVDALRKALDSGACSTSPWAWCAVKARLSALASPIPLP
jgi:protein tyrosine/serine phosphatase